MGFQFRFGFGGKRADYGRRRVQIAFFVLHDQSGADARLLYVLWAASKSVENVTRVVKIVPKSKALLTILVRIGVSSLFMLLTSLG